MSRIIWLALNYGKLILQQPRSARKPPAPKAPTPARSGGRKSLVKQQAPSSTLLTSEAVFPLPPSPISSPSEGNWNYQIVCLQNLFLRYNFSRRFNPFHATTVFTPSLYFLVFCWSFIEAVIFYETSGLKTTWKLFPYSEAPSNDDFLGLF